ncbi:MAG TPA: hypothetical protein VGE07_27745 [Herpetosiphonaceae bacterium]
MDTNLPLAVFSIDFRGAIELRDPRTDQPPAGPHWLRGGPAQPVAYPAGAAPAIEVAFLNLRYLSDGVPVAAIYARGTGGGVARRRVPLSFDGAGLSEPLRFTLAAPLPAAIGEHHYRFDWFAAYAGRPDLYLGSTEHRIFTTWRPAAPPLPAWAYAPVLAWSCQWAAGADSPKAICDALIGNLALSGLSYGLEGSQSVRSLLLRGGGTCGGWYRLFQSLAACQGVEVLRRDLTVVTDRELPPAGDRLWDGVVAAGAGLNQPAPAVDPYDFAEERERFPIGPAPVAVERVIARRYAFRGQPRALVGVADSTHALNFLVAEDGTTYLYDPSFGAGPLPWPGAPPEPGSFVSGAALAAFKASYLDQAFPFLIGSIRNGEVWYETIWRAAPGQSQYGLLVASGLVPPEALTIGWSVNGD